MSKCINEMTFDDIVNQEIKNLYKLYKESYDHDIECESYPFGDIYVNGDYYITEESKDKCFEDFKADTTPDVVIESLFDNCDFSKKIEELVKNFKGD